MLSPVYQVVLGKAGRALGVELDPLGQAVDPALAFAGKVDAGELAETVLGGLVLDRGLAVGPPIVVELGAEVVEEVVARHGQGGGHVVCPGRVSVAVVEDAGGAVVLAVRGS